MDISAVGSSGGLQAASAAIGASQARFEQAVENVVGDTLAGELGAPLVEDAVALKTEAVVNEIMFKVFAKQVEQQKSLINIISPQ